MLKPSFFQKIFLVFFISQQSMDVNTVSRIIFQKTATKSK